MNRALKIMLWIGGIIIAVPVGLILLGALGAIFGISDRPPSITEPVTLEATSPNVKPLEADVKPPELNAERAVSSRITLPGKMEAIDAMRWFVDHRFVNSRDGNIYVNFEKFKYLSMEDALTLHTLFSKAEHAEDIKRSTPETETLKRQYYMMHLFVFAGASQLPPDERKAFAKKSGAVFPTTTFHNLTPRGEYINLFDWHKRDTSRSAEIAIREYAKVFGDKEMIVVLEDIGGIEIVGSKSNPNANTRWRIHVGERLAQFEPETLQIIHDAIKKTLGGDRVKLRQELRDLIESRHTADTP